MARDFTPTNDKINFGSDAAIDGFTQLSIAGWMYIDAYTTTSGQRMAGKAQWSINAVNNGIDNAKAIQFFADFDGTDGAWFTPINSAPESQWLHIGASYNGASAANDPVIYINGVAQTLTEVGVPVGNFNSDAGADFIVGNNSTDVRGHDGKIGEIGYWNKLLAAGEFAALAKGYSPLFFRNGLKLYAPLYGNNSPELNLAGTGTGTITDAVKADHPRIIYPSGYQLMRMAANDVAAAAARFNIMNTVGM